MYLFEWLKPLLVLQTWEIEKRFLLDTGVQSAYPFSGAKAPNCHHFVPAGLSSSSPALSFQDKIFLGVSRDRIYLTLHTH